eukprot:7698705-Alexandrium_andersonii.AAC.1
MRILTCRHTHISRKPPRPLPIDPPGPPRATFWLDVREEAWCGRGCGLGSSLPLLGRPPKA